MLKSTSPTDRVAEMLAAISTAAEALFKHTNKAITLHDNANRTIVAREVRIGMAVAYTTSVEQRAIETVASIYIPHSDICLNAPEFTFFSTELVVRSGAPLTW